MVWVFFMAEKEGFEPSIPFWGIHDFQSCALGQLRDFSIPFLSSSVATDWLIIQHTSQIVKHFLKKFLIIFYQGKTALTPARSLRPLLDHRSQSYGLRPLIEGFSHGLRKCPPDTFLPSVPSGRPFKSALTNKKEHPSEWMGVLFWRRRRDLNYWDVLHCTPFICFTLFFVH